MDELKQKPVNIPLADLDYDRTRTRVALSQEAINRYAGMISNEVALDPAVIFRSNDGQFWPATGEHRKRAYQAANKDSMPCVILVGDRQAAIEFGIRDNSKHGAQLTPGDRQHNIRLMLQAHSDWSDRRIAEFCSVDHKTVGRQREKLKASGEVPHSEERIDKHGRSHAATQPPKPQSGEAAAGNGNGSVQDQTSQSAPDAQDDFLQINPVNKSKAYGKSAADLYEEICRKLGKLGNDIGVFNEIHPDNGHRSACREMISKLSTEIDTWRREVGITSKYDVAA